MNPIPYTRGAQLPDILRQRIVILDGAMGTMIQRYRLGEHDYRGERFKSHPKDLKGNNELLQFTRPDVIREIHEQYLEAGADILETNTFGATSVAQDDYGLGAFAREMNVAAARIARAACDQYSTVAKPRLSPDKSVAWASFPGTATRGSSSFAGPRRPSPTAPVPWPTSAWRTESPATGRSRTRAGCGSALPFPPLRPRP